MKIQKISQILKRFNIPFWASGKNVSVGSINVQCPFCNDTSNHCGIFEDTNLFHCWRCNEKGNLFKLLQEFTNISYKEYEEIVKNAEIDFKTSSRKQIEKILHKKGVDISTLSTKHKNIKIPEYAKLITKDTKSKLLKRFLKRRNIDLETCISNKCYLCEIGNYNNRMIIPLYWFLNELVGFQAIDLTGTSKLKYRTSQNTPSNKINNYFYNYPDVVLNSKRIILVEGILDVWRFGNDAISSFGTHLTEAQRRLIVNSSIPELIFCWDSDAYFIARGIAQWFTPFIKKIKIVKLPNNEDPDSFGRKETQNCIEETNWYIQ